MNDFPYKFISDISKKEVVHRKPIYSVHKWFSRKTDSLIRGILLSLMNKNVEKSFYLNNEMLLKNKIVLDPFFGGGTIPINVLRMGGKIVGYDINPVSWFITKCELESVEIEELKKTFNKIELEVGKEISNYYKIKNENGELCDVIYLFRSKKTKCSKCGKEIKIFPTYRLTNIKRKNFINYTICKNCGSLIKSNDEIVTCKNCGIKFNSFLGNYKRGKVTCECGNIFNLRDQKDVENEIIAIEYYDNKERKIKIPDNDDIKHFSEKFNIDFDFIPNQKIPYGDETKRLFNHNYFYWKDMFYESQLYFHSLLLKNIKEIRNVKIREQFLCLFSNFLNSNNAFCSFQKDYNKSEPLFGDHHFAPIVISVENNMWGAKVGSGTFKKFFQNYIKAKEFNYNIFEKNYNKNEKIFLEKEKINAIFAKNFEDLKDKNTFLICNSSKNMKELPDESIDYIITDPPYFSSINYSELSEFFYVWQRILLNNEYIYFKNDSLKKDKEIVVNKSRNYKKDDYIKELKHVFLEGRRVLKNNSYMVLTYNNNSIDGWVSIIIPIIESGFKIIKTYPVDIEKNSGLIDNIRNKMNFNLIIVCQKTLFELKEIKFQQFLKKVKKEILKNIYYKKSISYSDKVVIIMGKIFEVYSEYSKVYLNKSLINIEEIIKLYYEKYLDELIYE
ncbi:DNA methylase [Tepiditoga spiralis]|uniref:DNA methylase n=1 Tax=Tepiditoga spiralis TaxID=2108365 RepID=A0A7G1G9C2_9BACT|nr:hypothetical protein [Tepiditoga spiralis]BBE29919.1 DNA methylase [Tepiditoga spiralis]